VASQLQKNAYDDDPVEPFDELLAALPAEEKPFFAYSMTPQAVLPLHCEKVTIPKVMWCHDTDLFLYRGCDNFRLNDGNIVTTSQEHRSAGGPETGFA
jgi:hypothetical protein